MNPKKLEERHFQHSRGETYRCLTFDVTEEIRELFGIPVKEAFAVYERVVDHLDTPPNTTDDCRKSTYYELEPHRNSVSIPDGHEIFVVFDEAHTVCFWTSEWGGMKRTSLDYIDFGG